MNEEQLLKNFYYQYYFDVVGEQFDEIDNGEFKESLKKSLRFALYQLNHYGKEIIYLLFKKLHLI